MSKKSLFTLLAVVGACTLFAGASNVTAQTRKISPADGKGMYTSYCASCHGVNGKGNAKAASTLKKATPDLTMLSKNNNGVFPSDHVMGVIGHGTSTSGHDKPGMPVWGETLGKIDQNNKLDTPLRISNLSKYLETLQSK